MKQTMTATDILVALAVVAIWGVNFVVIKLGLQDLPPILFTALRFLFAAVPLVFFVPRPRVAGNWSPPTACSSSRCSSPCSSPASSWGCPPGWPRW